MRRLYPLIVIPALLGAAPGTAAPQKGERIVYRVRPNVMVCTGICPSFTLTMSEDRSVRVAIARGEARPIRYNFRASVRDAAAFRRELAAIRPLGTRQFAKPCNAGYENDEMVLPGVSNYEIRWRGGARADRLLACWGDEAVARASKRALAIIRVDWSGGERIGAREAHDILDCTRSDPLRC